MKLLVVIAAALAVACSEIDYAEEEKAYHRNKATMFKKYLFPFNKRVALEANHYSKGHFIVSAHEMWYSLGPLIGDDQQELYSSLNLPNDESLREKFYGLALTLEGVGEGIDFSKSRAIAVDETVDIKKDWVTFDDIPAGMPNYLRSVKYDKPFGNVQKYVMSYQPNIPYSSHTVLVDHSMFEVLWNPAFFDRAVQRGPFYNEQGEQTATAEYLRMKGKLRVAHSADNKIKVLEVPVGSDLSMLFAVGGNAETLIETVFSEDIFADLKMTEEPIEVAIPRLSMSSGLDMTQIFENIRRSKVFSDPAVTRKIPQTESPMGYYQLVSVNITDSVGRNERYLKDLPNEETAFAGLENGFIANRPFFFGLFAPLYLTDIRVPVFTGIYSYPGERGQQRIFDKTEK